MTQATQDASDTQSFTEANKVGFIIINLSNMHLFCWCYDISIDWDQCWCPTNWRLDSFNLDALDVYTFSSW